MTACKIHILPFILLLSLVIGCSGDPVISDLNGDSDVPVGEMKSAPEQLQNEPVQELTAPDATANARFGTSVAADKHTAVVGAPNLADGNSGNTGAVYIFSRQKDRWQFETILQPDAGEFSTFGRQVAISDGVIAVTGGNTVYVFERHGNSWNMTSVLEPEVVQPADQYGASLAVDGKFIAVGDPDFRDLGSVYIYEQKASEWQFAERVSASNGTISDRFGNAVSLSRKTLLSGSPNLNAGYLFERKGNGWNESVILEPEDPLPAGFGFSVSLSGKTAVAGRPLSSGGAAYIFEESQNNWMQAKKLTDPAGGGEDRLGQSVAIAQKLVAVGAPGLFDAPGKVYYAVNQGNMWGELVLLSTDGVQAGDRLGFSVAVSGKMILAGAPGDDGEASDAGKVYVYE